MAAYNYTFYSPDNSLDTIENDYLKDPDLWRDSLPQPYRMINTTLQELLMTVFEEVEKRRIIRENRNHIRKVPIVSDATLMMCLPVCNILATANIDEVDYVIGCGSMGIYIGHLKRSSSSEELSSTSDTTRMACDGHIGCISIQSHGGAIFIALIIDHEVIRILVYKNQCIHSVCQIDINSDQVEGTRKHVFDLSLSPTSVSHLALSMQTTTTTNNPASEGGDEDVPVITTSSSVAIYSLPIDQWIQQLQSSSEDNQQGVSFSGSPLLIYTLSPPLTTPSAANDPAQIMKLIQDKSAVTVPVDNIALTDAYLKARKHLFESQPHRRDFVHKDTNNTEHKLQKCCLVEFLFHYDGNHSSTAPLAVAVAWKKTYQLLIYQINKKANANMMADRVYLQGSYITSMTVNDDTTLMCLGLESGNISIIDIKKGIALGVVNLSMCSKVTIVKFAPNVLKNDEEDKLSQQPITIIGGCSDGSVHCVEWKSLTNSTHEILKSDNNQCESGIRDILFCTDIPSIVITEQDNGSIIVWQWLHDCQPLCALSLPSPFQRSVQYDHCHSVVCGSDSILAVSVKSINNSEYAIFSWSLSTCEVLRRALIDNSSTINYTHHPSTPRNNDPMDMILDSINIDRKSDEEMNEIMKKCWEELDRARKQ